MSFSMEFLEARTLFAAVRIMPLGDSITEGLDGQATYRYWLWKELQNHGMNVDFVGTRHGVAGTPRFSDFDQDHQGQAQSRADTIAAQITAWADATHPDIVLLHAGTNDLLAGQSTGSTIADLSLIIDRLRQVNPQVTVLLAKLIPCPNAAAGIGALNAQIPMLVAAKDSPASRVIAVDQFAGFNPNTDLEADLIHPDEAGEKKLAQNWYSALLPRLESGSNQMEYLADMPFLSARNGSGPVERNKSNGGPAPGDGRTLKLNGRLYRKGLGVHAQSDVRFDLGGAFKTFLSYAGVDDEVGNSAGSVIFRVYVDNAKVYDSGAVYGRTGTKSIVVDVTGAQTLRLLVTDKGDGNWADHADWAEARLVHADAPASAAGRAAVFHVAQPIDGSSKQPHLWEGIADLLGTI